MKTKLNLIQLITVTALVVIISCKKDATDSTAINSVSTTQKVLAIDFTATWCHVCGENGTPKLESVMAKNPTTVIAIAAHSAQSFGQASNSVSDELNTFYGITGIPSFVVGATESLYSYNSLEADVNKALATKTASAGIGMSKSVSGSTMTIATKTIFFKEISGTYNLAVYVTENSVSYNQTRDSAPTPFMKVHDHILRGSANGTWGAQLVSGSATKNQEINGSYTFSIPSTVKNSDNLHIVAVIYKMENGKPVSVLNVNSI